MKKIALFLCFGLVFTSSCFASPLDHLLSRMTKLEKTTNEPLRDPDEVGYTDFSGVWVGTCDMDPDITETFNIKMTDSSIIMDGKQYDIDAVITESIKSNLKFKEVVGLLRWNEDGSQLSATSLYYSLNGYMAKENMVTLITKMTMSMENNQLVTKISGHFYNDGIQQEELNVNATCTYNRESH